MTIHLDVRGCWGAVMCGADDIGPGDRSEELNECTCRACFHSARDDATETIDTCDTMIADMDDDT